MEGFVLVGVDELVLQWRRKKEEKRRGKSEGLNSGILWGEGEGSGRGESVGGGGVTEGRAERGSSAAGEPSEKGGGR